MKKSFYLALLFVGITLSSQVSAGNSAILTTGQTGLNTSTGSVVTPISPEAEDVNGSILLTTLPISGTLCSGSTVVVNFTSSGANYGINNAFTVELSDASGSFASPVTISVAPLALVGNVTSGQIYAQIPNGTPFGTGYRIRVVSSDPAFNGTDNGTNIVIKTDIAPPVPTVSINGPTDFCYGSATTFLTSSVAQNNLWFPGGVNTNPFIGVVGGGCYYTQVTGSNGCATSSYPVCINVNTPIFTFLGYFENGSLVTTADTTVTICEGDSAQLGLIIEGGVPPYDIFYTPNGLDVVTINDVGVPFNSESYVHTFYVSDAGFYQTIGITDNFPTNCGSNGNSGLVSIQTTPPPVTAFSYGPFCGSESQPPVGATGFLAGGVYSFDVAPSDAATINSSTGVISNATNGNTYIIRYTVTGQYCEASSTTSVTVNTSDITDFSIEPFCSNDASPAPVGVTGFATGGTYSFQSAPSDAAQIDASTGIITGASPNTTYIIVYTSAAGACQNSSSASVTTIASPSVTGTVVNTLCSESIGSIDASVSGGLAPYTYSWSSNETTEDISGLAANTYTLTVSDANGCTADSSFTITNTNEPELELTATNATCGNTNGTVDLTVTGGVGPFEFVWTPNNATSEDISGLSADTYTVEVTDNGTTCVVSGSATVINQDAPTVTFTSTDNLCGQLAGSIDVTVSLNGGSSTITHSWSNGATTEDLLGLDAGTYTDTVRDGNSCEVIITATIINSNQFTASSTVTNPTCASPNGGAIDVTIVGGTAPFTFVWTPNSAATSEDLSNLASGTYTVEITDAASCSTTVASTIAPINTIQIASTQVNATCGNTDGSIDLTVTGGSGDYSYEWSNGAITQDIASLDTGSYAVTVRDLADTSCTASLSVTIIYGNIPTLSFVNGPVSCTSDNGTIDITVNGGSGNYGYSWTGPNSYVSTDSDLTGLAAGTYNVTVTDLTSTCTVDGTTDVEPVNPPVVSAVTANTTCGQSNGIIDVTITGGTEPYTIDWSNLASGQDQINLTDGTYTLTVTDANGCEVIEEYTIAPSVQPTSEILVVQPTCGQDTGSVTVTLTDAVSPVIYSWLLDGAPFASFSDITDLAPGTYTLTATDGNGCAVRDTAVLAYPNQPTVETTVTNTPCGLSEGAIDLTISGGTPGFTIEWSNTNGFSASTEDIASLPFGCYDVTVTDVNGCTASAQACVQNENAPSITFETTNASCNLDNGVVIAHITGGVEPYVLTWTGSISTDTLLTDLAAGTYNLMVVDDNGCESIDSVSIINSGMPTLTATVVDPSCGNANGSIDAVVNGGATPYTYAWLPNGETTQDLNNLAAGTFDLTITDNAGCEITGSFTLENQNGPQLATTQVNALCGLDNASIDLTVTNGSGNYSFDWSGPAGFSASTEDVTAIAEGDYTVVVTDLTTTCLDSITVTISNSNSFTFAVTTQDALCGQSNGSADLTINSSSVDFTYAWTDGASFTASTQDITSVPAGDYTVVITENGSGCIDSTTVTISNSNSFTVSSVITNTTCNLSNGEIDLTITNGTAPFTFVWCNSQTTEDVTGLAAGTCAVTITDDSGCEVTQSFTIDASPSLSLSSNAVNATCGQCNGSIDLLVTNATAPITYLWSNGASVATLTNLCEGDYSVTVTDANGCTDSYSTTITVTPLPVLATTSVNSQCGQSLGSIDLTVTEGTAPFTYTWSGPAGFSAATEDISSIASGDYTVVVSDANSCSATTTVTITNTDSPVLAFSVTNTSCAGSTGAIDLTVSNSAGPFTYSWTGPAAFTASTEDLTGIPFGLYTVTVTASSCTVTGDTTIINSNAPTASISLSNDTICAGETLTLNIAITGNGPFTFVYNDGNVNQTATLSSAGTFSVAVNPMSTTTYTMVSLVSDNDVTCAGSFPVGTASVTVNPLPVQPTVTANGPVNFCEGGSVVLTSSAQTGNIWSQLGPDQLNQSITVTTSGSYYTVITNSFGCTDTSNVIVVDVQPSNATFAGNDTTICAGTAIQLTGTGANSYLWSPSIYLSGTIISNPVCTPFETTTYILTGTTACGVSKDTIVVTVLPIVNTDLGADQNVCLGQTVSLSVEDVSGATYAWEPAGSFIGSSTGSSVSFVVNAAVSVSVTATNSNGCVSSDTVQFNLNATPTAPTLTAQGPTTFCDGDSLVLQASTGNFVVWSNGLENFDEILVLTSGTYFVTAIDGICPATSDSIVVTVLPRPEATITTAGSTTVCQGTCVDLTAVQTTGVQWTLPNSTTSSLTTISACTSGYYVLEVTENGCTGSDSVLVNVIPQPLSPVVTLDGNDVICSNDFTTLTSSYATGNQWYLGGSPLVGETGNSITVNVGGIYTVEYTNGLGCSAISSGTVITVKPLTPLVITASSDTVLCGNNPETVTLSGSTGFIKYEWSNGGITQNVTINSAGTYTLTATNQDGCVSQADITFITAPAFNLTLSSPVYYDNYNVTVKGGTDGSINLTVDPSGIYAYSWSSGQTTEDLTGIPAGQYTVTVTDEYGCPQTGTIDVIEPGDIKLPNGFTPNGDGYNDFYVIKGIQGFPDSQLDIFNRWGNLVYSKKGYTNDWNGISNDGNELPDGTYFIVVDLNAEGKENVKGSIDLRRK